MEATTVMTHAKQTTIAAISTRLIEVPKKQLARMVVMKGLVEKITVKIVTGMKLMLDS